MLARYHLRPAVPADFSFIRGVHHASLRDVVTQVWGWDQEFQDKLFCDTFDAKKFQIIQVDDVDIGALEDEIRPDEWFLSNILIAPEHQGQGIGTRVILDLFARATAGNLPVTLTALRPNHRAKKLYERLGFVVKREDEVRYWMRRDTITS